MNNNIRPTPRSIKMCHFIFDYKLPNFSVDFYTFCISGNRKECSTVHTLNSLQLGTIVASGCVIGTYVITIYTSVLP